MRLYYALINPPIKVILVILGELDTFCLIFDSFEGLLNHRNLQISIIKSKKFSIIKSKNASPVLFFVQSSHVIIPKGAPD